MPRIEQLPNGTYVKRLTPFEADLIDRLYQEIRERTKEASLMTERIIELEAITRTLQDEVNALKAEIIEIE